MCLCVSVDLSVPLLPPLYPHCLSFPALIDVFLFLKSHCTSLRYLQQYPLIYKTLRVDATFNAKQAVKFIADTVNVTSLLVGTEGLYIPDEKRWLDDDVPLSTYDSLQDVVRFDSRLFLSLLCTLGQDNIGETWSRSVVAAATRRELAVLLQDGRQGSENGSVAPSSRFWALPRFIE